MEILAGPIPGENFTSDTKNYPWHRAPEIDDLDEAIEYTAKKITARDASIQMMTLAKNDIPLTAIAQMFLMGGVMRGKWTPDYALLMAGPTVHILSLMAKASKVPFSLGIEEGPVSYTDAFYKAMKELDASEQAATEAMGGALEISLGGDTEAPTEALAAEGIPSTGFAGAAAQDPSMGLTEGMPDGAPMGPDLGAEDQTPTEDINNV